MLRKLFQPSAKYQGVLPIQVYMLKLFFLLMFVFAAKDAWVELFSHQGVWDPEIAIAWCAMAAYTTLSCLGIFHTLRMLPIMLFMFFYKGLWLIFVAYPLWQTEQLAGTAAGDWSQIFLIMVVPMLFTPWRYVFKTFVLGR
ncbi:MAG: hypothetical protein AAGJ18_26765 [Bacteroidota bacterium]